MYRLQRKGEQGKVKHSSLITLHPYTRELCHEFWRCYVADFDMLEKSYIYDEATTNRYFDKMSADESRRLFVICLEARAIGEIQLKRIDFEKGCATMSVHLANDTFKNRGYGTEAEQLIIAYAFHELGLHTLYADCVHRNKRSAHVLEKVGFTFTHEDDVLRYYVLNA